MNSKTCKEVFSCEFNINVSKTPDATKNPQGLADNNNPEVVRCPSAATTMIPLASPEAEDWSRSKMAVHTGCISSASDRKLSPSIFRCKRTVPTKPQWHQQQQQQQTHMSPLHALQIAALWRLTGHDCAEAGGANGAQRQQHQLHLAPPPLIIAPEQTPSHTPVACGSPLPTTSGVQEVFVGHEIVTNATKAANTIPNATTVSMTDAVAGSSCPMLAERLQALLFENAALRQTLAGIALAAGMQRHQMQQQRMQQIVEQQKELELRKVRHEMLVGSGCGKHIGGWLADVRKRMERGECWRQRGRGKRMAPESTGDAPDISDGEDNGENNMDDDEDDESEDNECVTAETGEVDVWDGVVRVSGATQI
ncbi:hypothetical protein HDU82_007407 [Entophlyctis luteolus]|nr:hypothetical protein HDU82_007407 [Entophlyctis luteolus]